MFVESGHTKNGQGPNLLPQRVFDQFGNTNQARPPSDTTGSTAATTNSVFG